MKQSFWETTFGWQPDPQERTLPGQEEKCELLGPVGIAMQLLLGAMSFSSLFAKRYFEFPKRSMRIFLLDISKQAGSAFWNHMLNTFFAIYLEKALSRGDGCDWYFLNFVSEIVFVLFFSYLLHSAIVYFAEKNDILVLQSGVYLSVHDAQYLYLYSYEDLDKHINYKVWTIQFLVWLIISTLAKII